MAKYLDIRWDLENNSFTVINPETQEPLQSSVEFPSHLQPVNTHNVGLTLMSATSSTLPGKCDVCRLVYINGFWYWICA